MFVVDGSVVTSASDLKKASECEFAFLRELDVKLGRDTLFEPIRTHLADYATLSYVAGLEVVPAVLGTHAGLIGAAAAATMLLSP